MNHATTTRCRKCARPILTAFVEGLTVRVDPWPLNPAGELAAILRGALTYDAEPRAAPPSVFLAWRNPERIRAGPRHPVLADHACPGRPDPTPLPLPAPPPAPTHTTEAPF